MICLHVYIYYSLWCSTLCIVLSGALCMHILSWNTNITVTAIKVTFSHLRLKEITGIAICISHILGSLHQGNIKTSGSESQDQEAAWAHVVRHMWSLQWVIYTDGNSKFLKCCSSATTYYSYCLVYYRSNTSYWVEPTVKQLIELAQPFLRTSRSVILVLISMAITDTRLTHPLILNLVQYYYFYVMVNHP